MKKYGPRGVTHAYADGKVEDTGPLSRKRMETVDAEFGGAAKKFMAAAVAEDKPFFVWMNFTRMHVWTRLQEKYRGKTGISLYADGMAELDDMVGSFLEELKKLGVDDNTIVVFSTVNGAEKFTWPDGGASPYPRRERHDLGRWHACAAGSQVAGYHRARHGLQRHHEPGRLDADTGGGGWRP